MSPLSCRRPPCAVQLVETTPGVQAAVGLGTPQTPPVGPAVQIISLGTAATPTSLASTSIKPGTFIGIDTESGWNAAVPAAAPRYMTCAESMPPALERTVTKAGGTCTLARVTVPTAYFEAASTFSLKSWATPSAVVAGRP